MADELDNEFDNLNLDDFMSIFEDDVDEVILTVDILDIYSNKNPDTVLTSIPIFPSSNQENIKRVFIHNDITDDIFERDALFIGPKLAPVKHNSFLEDISSGNNNILILGQNIRSEEMKLSEIQSLVYNPCPLSSLVINFLTL